MPERVELHKELLSGAFTLPGDVQLAEELLLLIEHLDGITSTIKSDHILNLFQEAEGRLPEEKEQIMAPFRKFLALPPAEQLLYRVGRRTGILSSLHDLEDPSLRAHAEQARLSHGVTPETIDAFTTEMMKRFI